MLSSCYCVMDSKFMHIFSFLFTFLLKQIDTYIFMHLHIMQLFYLVSICMKACVACVKNLFEVCLLEKNFSFKKLLDLKQLIFVYSFEYLPTYKNIHTFINTYVYMQGVYRFYYLFVNDNKALILSHSLGFVRFVVYLCFFPPFHFFALFKFKSRRCDCHIIFQIGVTQQRKKKTLSVKGFIVFCVLYLRNEMSRNGFNLFFLSLLK